MTPATVGDAILQDIIAHPEADDLRRIYADWLEEFDGEYGAIQAAFIRDALTRPAEIRVTTYHRRDATVLVEGGTLADETHTFAGDLPIPAEQRSSISYGWRRGFISEIACACDFWLQHGPRLAQKWPLERVELTDKEPLDSLPHSPAGQWANFTMTLPSGNPDRSQLPIPLLPHLSAYPRRQGSRQFIIDYDTMEAAREDLSAACLAWARSVKCLACNDTGAVQSPGGLRNSCPDCFLGAERTQLIQEGMRRLNTEPSFQSLYQGTWPRTGGE